MCFGGELTGYSVSDVAAALVLLGCKGSGFGQCILWSLGELLQCMLYIIHTVLTLLVSDGESE